MDEGKNTIQDFDRIVGRIIEVVDGRCFPGALQCEKFWTTTVMLYETDDGPGIARALETSWGRAAFELLHSAALSAREPKRTHEIEDAICSVQAAGEIVGMAVGFACGLRAGGSTKVVAREKLRGFLRNFESSENKTSIPDHE